MDFALSEDQPRLHDEIVRLATEELDDDLVERDRSQDFPRELWRKCGAMGIQGLPVPDAYGGSGVEALTCAIALDALGWAARSIPGPRRSSA
ncbi:MAG TPA: acyl-CoA dehydrogenase family protein [Casimicrobiaceae bacterium]|nr:acyl-CoA dehydrogenase family protein [Casimicrobiaceae bacterium]